MTESQDRWIKGGATPGQDPREIDAEQQDPELVAEKAAHRSIRHADEETGVEMGTSSTTRDPFPRDER